MLFVVVKMAHFNAIFATYYYFCIITKKLSDYGRERNKKKGYLQGV